MGAALRESGARDGIVLCTKRGYLASMAGVRTTRAGTWRRTLRPGILAVDQIVAGTDGAALSLRPDKRAARNLGVECTTSITCTTPRRSWAVPRPEFLRHCAWPRGAQRACDEGRIACYGTA